MIASFGAQSAGITVISPLLVALIFISLQSSLVVTKHMINHEFVLVMVLTTPLTALTLKPLVNTSLSCPIVQILSSI